MSKKILFLLVATSIIGYAGYMSTQRRVADPKTYTPLLGLIAKVESSSNYNAYFGNPTNATVDFTRMSIAEVMQWQNDYVSQGSPSSAVGRYQILNDTLRGLVEELGLNPKQKFDHSTQDKMAIALLERRGADLYINKEISREQFAASLAKEWAALPKMTGTNPQASYYAGDGLNKSRVSPSEVLRAIEPIKAK